jgi:alpha-beta hydrolase superfamily lysophospholipase
MEKNIKIKLDNKHVLYGKLQGSLKQPLFIVVHGLPCSMNETFYEMATRWFAKRGFATFRFNLYGWQKGSRQLVDSTLASHANDIDVIVRFFRKRGFKKIFVAGHSFGGPSILLSKRQEFDAAVLWDPSYKISFVQKKYGAPGGRFVKAVNGYYMKWGVNVIIGKAMAQEVDRVKWDELTPNFHVPLKIIAAGKGVLVKGAGAYFKNANEPKSLETIKGATHYFDEVPEMQERVYLITKKWFDRF